MAVVDIAVKGLKSQGVAMLLSRELLKKLKGEKQKMGLFNKKLSLEDILSAIDNLSDDEKAQIKEKVSTPIVEEEVEQVEETPSNEETVDEAVEETPEVPEELEEGTEETAPVEETAPTEETNEGGEELAPVDEQPEEPIPEEPSVEETEQVEQAPEVVKQEDELKEAQSAKIQALEEKVANLEERLEQVLSSLENQDFGLNPAIPEGGGEDHNRLSAVMRGYAGGNAKKYF